LSDKLKTTSAIVVFTLGIVGFYVLDGQPLVLQVLSVLIGLGLSLFIFKQSAKGNELFTFLNSVVLEAKKSCMADKKRNSANDTGGICGSRFNGYLFSISRYWFYLYC